MRLLFIGDVVGRSGRKALSEHLPRLRERYALDFVIVNGENAAAGFGITESIFEGFLDAGADAVTLGNHAFDQRDTLVWIGRQDRLVRPLNFPPETPGRGVALIEAQDGRQVLVVNALGRVFMNDMDCPFRALDRELDACPLGTAADAIVVDFHAEATSEKQAMGHYVDGRASLVVGTHTHTPTSDDRVLPGGTAYMSDAGMTGDYSGVLGMDADEPMHRFVTRLSRGRFQPGENEASICGVAVETDDATGLALKVEPLRLGGSLRSAEPQFWVV
ncbi:MAG: TIGR00282 family metallophosphoesterase [Pseudomonadota bacterium]